jgi:cyclic pyranopterin phosphate synthase
MGMVDVTEKPIVKRQAEAEGKIYLSPDTIGMIKKQKVKKGDPFLVAEVAAMNAAKQTYLLIPHCHQIALDTVSVTFRVSNDFILATCRVRTQARTGVEMEAIVGVSAALSTVWDLVNFLEKDSGGQYPETSISYIRVIKKEKGV